MRNDINKINELLENKLSEYEELEKELTELKETKENLEELNNQLNNVKEIEEKYKEEFNKYYNTNKEKTDLEIHIHENQLNQINNLYKMRTDILNKIREYNTNEISKTQEKLENASSINKQVLNQINEKYKELQASLQNKIEEQQRKYDIDNDIYNKTVEELENNKTKIQELEEKIREYDIFPVEIRTQSQKEDINNLTREKVKLEKDNKKLESQKKQYNTSKTNKENTINNNKKLLEEIEAKIELLNSKNIVDNKTDDMKHTQAIDSITKDEPNIEQEIDVEPKDIEIDPIDQIIDVEPKDIEIDPIDQVIDIDSKDIKVDPIDQIIDVEPKDIEIDQIIDVKPKDIKVDPIDQTNDIDPITVDQFANNEKNNSKAQYILDQINKEFKNNQEKARKFDKWLNEQIIEAINELEEIDITKITENDKKNISKIEKKVGNNTRKKLIELEMYIEGKTIVNILSKKTNENLLIYSKKLEELQNAKVQKEVKTIETNENKKINDQTEYSEPKLSGEVEEFIINVIDKKMDELIEISSKYALGKLKEEEYNKYMEDAVSMCENEISKELLTKEVTHKNMTHKIMGKWTEFNKVYNNIINGRAELKEQDEKEKEKKQQQKNTISEKLSFIRNNKAANKIKNIKDKIPVNAQNRIKLKINHGILKIKAFTHLKSYENMIGEYTEALENARRRK